MLNPYEIHMRRLSEMWAAFKGYFVNLAVGLDQFLNTLLGGWPDMTLSSRAYLLDRDKGIHIPRMLLDGLFFWRHSHCLESYLSERRRAQLPPEFRPEDFDA